MNVELTSALRHLAALEVEDLDIGYDDDLAGDVDDGEEDTSHDPEALDTDDEADEDERLGIDTEESEGDFSSQGIACAGQKSY